ncbi:peptidoglycan DD-metalloendopeptidase family protein [Leucobacter viscericola]|uniref:Peptidoglycan DD-metalloendopeptidase family protein n=1 Tax=Leucobacter viscericola TaxID=2714935 RepID=A0A6G7XBK4_9MICO|nr:peptidoglycan DD-metalloendopeptidase family protein [Leucobacter viscericola]QIK61882.1 peptidoglycan DD-metalloendopeptidase family protein [Leucobacter viscericola]
MAKHTTARKKFWVRGILAAALAITLAAPAHFTPVPAQATDLPTWDDVQNAKKNEAAAAAKAKEIEGLIASGEKELTRLRNSHAAAAEAMREAQQKFNDAAWKADSLVTQAADSKKKADDAADRAGVIVAQMYRSGGVDRSLELMLEADPKTSDALLDRLASMSKATERNSEISGEAEQAANTAASLGKQAEAAKKEREALLVDLQAKEAAAAKAVEAQRSSVVAQEAKQNELTAQLAALKDTTTSTVAGYEKRVREEEAERKRLEEEARKNAENAANNNNSGGGGGGGGGNSGGGGGGGGNAGSGGGGGHASNGWIIPTSNYYISEGFRPPERPDHTGLDLAAPCGTPIVAPVGGTVSIAGWIDNFGGNMVYLHQDDGYQTRFAHMIGWPPVSAGQYVQAGQVIGWVGTTGASTGCHLHFEVIPGFDDNYFVPYLDPYPFLFG